MTARYIIGDTRDVTATMPDASVDLILTSPPFLALRSYLPDDHPDKHREIGSEATPADFLDVLLDLTEEWARVLTPHGSIVVELGDTYSGSGGAGGDYNDDGLRAGQGKFDGSARRSNGDDWPMPKSLTGIPHLYHLSLAYGRNLLRPERLTDPWRIRNVIAWCRPNPPVGALGDKFRPATSYMTVATKARDRWFDLDAVREPYKNPELAGTSAAHVASKMRTSTDYDGRNSGISAKSYLDGAGAPPLDWWQVSTEPYAGSHYATWPRKLLTRPILAMCPERVCTAIVCNHCGHAHQFIRDHHVGEVAMGREAVSLPAALQAELRHLRDVLRRQEPVHLLSELSVEAHEADEPQRASTEGDADQGTHQSRRVHTHLETGPSVGGQGLRVGTQTGDGAAARSLPGPDGDGASPQWGEARQPARKPRNRDTARAHGRSGLPSLQQLILDSLICPNHHDNQRGFSTCGQPSRRIVGEAEYVQSRNGGTPATLDKRDGARVADGVNQFDTRGQGDSSVTRVAPTLGWSDCGHGTWRTGVVLDCFGGSGTTGAVATGHGRNCLLIDIDERNAELAMERIGPLFCEVAKFNPDGSHLPDWLVSPGFPGGVRASA